MKKTYIIAGLSACLALMTSCQNFLDEDPKGRLTADTFFSTQEELDMGTYALYRQVMNSQNNTNPLIIAWQGDDITTHPGSNKQAYADVDAFHPTDGNKGAAAVWNSGYKVIKAANYLINNAEKTPTTQEEVNIAIGQAKFWRAVSYFKLVRVFGPVPMNLSGEVDYSRPLASVEEIYNQIVADLKDCVEILPTSYAKAPRKMNGANIYITKQAAQSVLAAVYMGMAGWPLNKTEYYKEAAASAKAVIDGVKAGKYEYMLEPSYNMVYAPSHNYTNETIVGINYNGSYVWDEDSEMAVSDLFESLGGWGDGWSEYKFWKDFPAGARKDATISPKIVKNNGRNGETELIDWWEVEEKHPMYCNLLTGTGFTDYDYTKPAGGKSTNSHRHRLVRYAEVLLWYAESQARSEGTPNALAYDCINQVRHRAGLENLPTGMSGNEFAEACVKEHGWEIAGYWPALVCRRQDLFRLNRLESLFNYRKKNAPIEITTGVMEKENVLIPDNVTWNGDKSIYLPYPADDASLNSNIRR
ncbi:RagB/SusD family nutrient uptake outer membrane protein [Prevotella sp. S7 MS 2]|uniref:RagB/SusD family nutrient uptake outer membrane protein n=1 Tax=Prevotella sp. S7 MS 2 TaxID=1287488 RepID=UPI000512F474|nr:RagB/SusD family nutrient uptake outer membrane protein [Prevotella sp. S7 MS 2]KGI60998.1 membrane protein [Prevotella sp. S7 MS 2]